MLEKMLTLASYSYYEGGVIGDVLNTWADAGLFSYILPFLLIFAIVFGILDRMGLFDKNRGINAVIALSVGLLSIQLQMVPRFFEEVFPRFGIAIIIILVSILLLGAFVNKKQTWIFLVISGIVLIGLFVYTSNALTWGKGTFFADYWPHLLLIAVVVTMIALSIGKKNEGPAKQDSILAQSLSGN